MGYFPHVLPYLDRWIVVDLPYCDPIDVGPAVVRFDGNIVAVVEDIAYNGVRV